MVGLSDDAIPDDDDLWIGEYSNSFAIHRLCTECWLDGELHQLELQGAIRPVGKEYGNVYGCGLVLDSENNVAIFFTLNGQLLGEFCMRELRSNKIS
jgi:hypothetical protein